ncbi:hypothetical protein IT571_05435 [Candidatus Sumerlaeota bacterium]|nr:hypothetical protein [Candidatus Sumerlaeota bacterium]
MLNAKSRGPTSDAIAIMKVFTIAARGFPGFGPVPLMESPTPMVRSPAVMVLGKNILAIAASMILQLWHI